MSGLEILRQNHFYLFIFQGNLSHARESYPANLFVIKAFLEDDKTQQKIETIH